MPPSNNSPRNGSAGLRAATGITPAPQQLSPAEAIGAMIKAEMPRIQRLIQNPKMAARFGQLAMTEIRKNPTLAKCEPSTVLGCLMTAASTGLQVGVGGQCYLIPYFNRRTQSHICTFVPGWQGYMALMHRSGEAEAQTGCVRKGDLFRYTLGSDPYIEHEPRGDRDGEITHFYAWGRSNDAKYPIIEVWTYRDIELHLAKVNKVGEDHYALKDKRQNFEMYGRKVALLQVLKYLPRTFEMDVASDLDGQQDSGKQRLSPDNVIEGIITPITQVEDVPDSNDVKQDDPPPPENKPEREPGEDDGDIPMPGDKPYDFGFNSDKG